MAQAIVAICVFTGLIASFLWCARCRTTTSAFALAALSGLWLVANNNVFEGPILLTVNDQHGLTLMDLFSYLGALTAVVVQLAARPAGPVRRDSRRRGAAARIAIALATAALVGAGLAASYFYQPNG